MITTPTVLILGAGASCPFGFPSGGRLLELICKQDNAMEAQLVKCGFDRAQIESFRTTLQRSGAYSVDAFLERQPTFTDVGKAAIAYQLIACEDIDRLFEPRNDRNEENWYRLLFKRLDAPLDEWFLNRLSIITFNYDRSLEAFLYTAFKNKYAVTDKQAADALSVVSIVHVHGQLGLLDWQEPLFGVNAKRDYDTTINPETVLNAARGIRIIHEEQPPTFAVAHHAITEAQRIYFLGFGYHLLNMQRLRLIDAIGGRNVQLAGSFYGFAKAEIEHLAHFSPGKKMFTGHPIHGVCQFLRHDAHFQRD